ncbi:MAG TPA: peptidoglycan editing factor PgeF [Proteobacteria bacterium]|nr:peptidoglycan editing factor PgeF [Pseudomonadota bacterium]
MVSGMPGSSSGIWFDSPLPFYEKGALVMFCGRRGGTSKGPYESLNASYKVGDDPKAVARNREMIARAMGVDPGRLVTMRQVHGTAIVEANEPFDDPPLADALYTTNPELVLCVLTADCIPLAAFWTEARLLLMAHVGWRGALQRFPELIVRHLKGLGADAHDLLFALGPSIKRPWYMVGEDVRQRFDRLADSYRAEDYFTDIDGGFIFDLTKLVVDQLKRAGANRENIWVSEYCTFFRPDLFFSYRRDGKRSGRQMSCGRIMAR